MIAVVIPTCSEGFSPPKYSDIPVFVVFDPPQHPRGFASSCNIGIAKAHSQGFSWVLVCNDDAHISFVDLQKLVSHITDQHGVIAPIIQEDQGIQNFGIFVSSWGRVRVCEDMKKSPNAFSAACFLVPSWVRFDNGYIHGFEDIALCRLLEKRGKKQKLVFDATCNHKSGGTLPHYSRRWFASSVYGQLRFYSSHRLTPIIVGLALLQARYKITTIKGVFDGWRLWKGQRKARVS